MRKIELSEFKSRIKERFPNESFTVLKYSSLGEYGEIKCDNCDRIITLTKAGNFLAKTKKFGCSECQSKLVKKQKEVMEEILKRYNILDSYVIDTHKHYKLQCKECGHIRTTTPRNIGRFLECGCKTGVKRERTPEEFIQEVNQYSVDGTYELVGDYINQTTPVLLRHSCGFIWKTRPGEVIHGKSRCPKCSRKRSRGEKLIENYLKESGIEFEVEKLLDNNSRQRFDFYLENFKYKIAIEFNGEQHYKETNYFSTNLETLQERDKRKAEYCLQNNIELVIIPYTLSDNEIYKILQNIINKFND